MRKTTLFFLLTTILIFTQGAHARLPNIIFILADDLGYGDVGCYNPESRVPTPHLDKMAKEGMRFTDAHAPSTVCTPSRYSLLTGEYCWRTPFKRGVLTGVDGPLIAKDRLTAAQFLKNHGYATACVGKWHVGMTFYDKEGKPVAGRGGGVKKVKQVDFSRPISDGPNDKGFDYFFGTVCCPTTDWLYAYLENKKVVQAPDRMSGNNGNNWLEYAYHRDGFMAPDFKFDRVDLDFMEKSKAWMARHTQDHPDRPFFLYHAAQAVHLPAIPAEQFKGSTPAGPLGDFIHEFDYVVGQLLQTIKELGIDEQTLVMVSSDNGPEIVVPRVKKEFGHDSAHPWRGLKRDNWEGGHRVPFIARWPGSIPAGTTSDEMACLTDFMATAAGVIGQPLPAGAAPDSVNLLPALLDQKADKPLREYLVHHAPSGKLAIRQGKWKFLDHKGSGGNNYERFPMFEPYRLKDKDPDAPGQLYNLAADPGETHNLYSTHPEVRERLQSLLAEVRKAPGSGSSTKKE